MNQTVNSQLPLWIMLWPLIGFLINGVVYPSFSLGVSRTKNLIAGTIATVVMLIAFAVAYSAFRQLAEGSPALHLPILRWVEMSDLSLGLDLHFDRLSAIMCLIITGIGSLIHLYSIGYMAHEPGSARFFAYLNLFCFAMLLLVLSDNLLFVFFGWEGVGLCSYLLISYWYGESANADAARKAFLVNRIGDFGFVIAMCMLYAKYGTLSFVQLLSLVSPESAAFIGGVALLLFFAATGKSAQLPLYVWLPDAMAGPTPVSALIHAATMVTAGVYLFARMHFLFELAPTVMSLVAWTGALTALLGGTIALAQNDIKKVLAYSTVSQLGFMFLALGVGNYHAAVFHLMTHAFFKALLFLGAGSVIHACDGEQDMRQMGGLAKSLPITHATMLLGSLAIVGAPLFSGFFSKDEILFSVSTSPRGSAALFAIGLIAAFLTSIYMTRLLNMTFWSKARAGIKGHESPWSMTLPLLVLAVLATLGGFLGVPHEWAHSFGLSGNLLADWLQPVVPAPLWSMHEGPFSELAVSSIATGLSALGVLLGYLLFKSQFALPIAPLERLLSAKYWVDELYGKIFVRPLYRLSESLARWLEGGIMQNLGAWLGTGSNWSGDRLRAVQNGDLQAFTLIFLGGLSLIVAISLFWTHL